MTQSWDDLNTKFPVMLHTAGRTFYAAVEPERGKGSSFVCVHYISYTQFTMKIEEILPEDEQ